MPKGAIVINTARKEVIDEAGLTKMMEERPDFKYITDIKPAIDADLAAKYPDRYFATPKRWVHRLPKQISMPVLLLQNKSWISFRMVTRSSELINKSATLWQR